MKKIFIVLGTFFLAISCTSKYEKAIADFEQTDGSIKLDLGFKAKDIKELKAITVADSIQIIQDEILPLFDREIAKSKKLLQEVTEKYIQDSIYYSTSAFSADYIEIVNNRGSIESIKKEIEKREATKDNYANFYKDYKDKDEKLVALVECTYSMNSLKHDGVKAEKTNTYVISAKTDKVLGYEYEYDLDLFKYRIDF